MDRVVALMHPRALESFRDFVAQLGGDGPLQDTPLAGRDLASVPADSVFLAFMRGTDGAADEQLDEMFGGLEVQTLGHVPQGDSLAHVVYVGRLALMEQQVQHTALLTLRRYGDGWRVDPGDGPMAALGGVMTLFMQAGMQAGMAGLGGMDGGHDHDDDDSDADDDHADEEDEDDDPPSS